MEYLYIIGIIGYYLYQAYSKSKKDKPKEVVAEGQPQTTKKKGFLEELLEEMDKMNDKPGKSSSPPAPRPSQPYTIPAKKAQKRKPVAKVSSLDTIQDRIDSYVYNDQQIAEGIRSTVDDAQPTLSVKDKAPSRFRLRGTNLSARDAVVAQVILERKF